MRETALGVVVCTRAVGLVAAQSGESWWCAACLGGVVGLQRAKWAWGRLALSTTYGRRAGGRKSHWPGRKLSKPLQPRQYVPPVSPANEAHVAYESHNVHELHSINQVTEVESSLPSLKGQVLAVPKSPPDSP